MISFSSLTSIINTTTSATSISSNVEWNASIIYVGRSFIKPTVSVNKIGRCLLFILRVVVDNVEKSLFSTYIFSFESIFNKLLFPAFV